MSLLTIGLLIVNLLTSATTSRETVQLLNPPNEATRPLNVTFRWQINNARTGVVYCSEIITDKGVNPFDGNYEDRFIVRDDTELQIQLPARRYNGVVFEWGVRVAPCGTRNYVYSSVRRLRTIAGGGSSSL